VQVMERNTYSSFMVAFQKTRVASGDPVCCWRRIDTLLCKLTVAGGALYERHSERLGCTLVLAPDLVFMDYRIAQTAWRAFTMTDCTKLSLTCEPCMHCSVFDALAPNVIPQRLCSRCR
jgi:hypothetical protein